MIKKWIVLSLALLFCASAQAQKIWKEHRARHFFIYYDEAPENFVKEVEEAAESYYDKISRNIGLPYHAKWSHEERAKIYIYNDRADFMTQHKNVGWAHGIAQVRQKVIRTFPAESGFFDTTLPHELGHILFRELVGYRVQLPLWFEEGVAMHQEQARRWGADKKVRQALEEGAFIPLHELTRNRLYRSADQAMIELFYAESASIVNYMISRIGPARFKRFCQRLKELENFEWALKETYPQFGSINDLNERWLKYLKNE